jgi:hypothetical protein
MYKYFFQRWNFHMINMTEMESHLKQRAVPLQTPLLHHEYDPQDDNYEAHYDRVEDSALPPILPQDLPPTDSKTRMSEIERQLEGSLRTIGLQSPRLSTSEYDDDVGVDTQSIDLQMPLQFITPQMIVDAHEFGQEAMAPKSAMLFAHQTAKTNDVDFTIPRVSSQAVDLDPIRDQDDEYAGNYANVGSSAFPPNLPRDLPTTLQFPASERPVYDTAASNGAVNLPTNANFFGQFGNNNGPIATAPQQSPIMAQGQFLQQFIGSPVAQFSASPQSSPHLAQSFHQHCTPGAADLTGIGTDTGYNETEDFRKSIYSDEDEGHISATTPATDVTLQE